jgi:hypothetical protein
VDSKTRREFHEGIACELLARDGIAVVWRLHQDAAQAYRDGYPQGAEILLHIADAAEELVWRAGTPELASWLVVKT